MNGTTQIHALKIIWQIDGYL